MIRQKISLGLAAIIVLALVVIYLVVEGKVKSDLIEERQIQNIIKDSNARIVTVNKEFFVIEKSGRRNEIELLHRELSVFGIMQFVRSGRIAVTKDEMKITEMLAAFNN